MPKKIAVVVSLSTIVSMALPTPSLARASNAPAPSSSHGQSVIMQAMQKELERELPGLKNAGPAPVHYLAYRIYDQQSTTLTASYGALDSAPEFQHSRTANIELRVGTPQLDSTHRSRSGGSGFNISWHENASIPIEDAEDAIRAALWNDTDNAFKNAQKAFKEAQTNKDVLVAEEDESDDFSKETPQVFMAPAEKFTLDTATWEQRLRRASAIFKQHPQVLESHVSLQAVNVRRFLVSSEGTKLEDERVHYLLFALARATADDGMQVWLYDHLDGPNAGDLPDDTKLKQMVDTLATNLEQLRAARPAEPFAGPVILRPKAAGVFFHEVFGHRAEGHRQKDEDEGRTFTKMVGRRIMPDFISVLDDPTREKYGGHWLNGYYRFDDEGVPSQKVVLVDHGVLKGFLMSRSPIKGFTTSNGHGRCMPGREPVARQGNLIVEASSTVPYSQLRQMLIDEARRQKKPYGLVFDEIAGGFTMTQSWMPQVFKLLPLRVYRVYTDGRPDELLRGVSIIGTPLVSLEHIAAAANDCGTFNGSCGAESGWVPVSASAPSLMLTTLEVERQQKQQDKPPLLPPPSKGT